MSFVIRGLFDIFSSFFAGDHEFPGKSSVSSLEMVGVEQLLRKAHDNATSDRMTKMDAL
ncbi:MULTISPECIES: hypothetical protein [unclassified Fibrobacter]|uniref:hypothetical protein n=1 Tax=unclassified Fibrobacter TaxID=2634177 RepID=UPI001483524C|nr:MULTISPECIES: hypothetical protein [unclassified Fibrobacter]